MSQPAPFSTHLSLVSNQATPNLTPSLDPAVQPHRVILLVSPDMQRRADWLEGVLRVRGIRVERWAIDDAWDIEHIQTRVLELLEAEGEAVAAGAIALNATGGTKPMSIAAYETFRAYDLPIFYVHPEQDRLFWLHPAAQQAVDLANRVRLQDFLAAHGAGIDAAQYDAVPPRLQRLTDWLVDQSSHIQKALSTLNWLAASAKGGLRSRALERHQLEDGDLAHLIQRFAANRLLELEEDRLRFPDEAARFYVNGGWLEEHVYTVLRDLRRAELTQIQDLARSIDIHGETTRGDRVRNEIDVACLAENRLYIIECKTRKWDGDDAAASGANALYRLDTLSDLLGGLQARSMLVSYRDLPPYDQRRAANLRVAVCAGSRLRELRTVLHDWMSRPTTRTS